MKNTLQITLFLATLFLIPSCSISLKEGAASNDSKKLKEPEFISREGSQEADADSQADANESLSKLIAYFGEIEYNAPGVAPKYPEYYGGAFINENSKLVVYIPDDSEKSKLMITSIAGSNDIEFRKSEYSYQYLTEVMDTITDYMRSNGNSPVVENINVCSLMDLENRIEVLIEDNSEEKIAEFKKLVSNSPAIIFKQSSGKIQLE